MKPLTKGMERALDAAAKWGFVQSLNRAVSARAWPIRLQDGSGVATENETRAGYVGKSEGSMPFEELVQYLLGEGDAIVRKTEGGPGKVAAELWTEQGRHYVRSQEGLVMTGRSWLPKWIWVRV